MSATTRDAPKPGPKPATATRSGIGPMATDRPVGTEDRGIAPDEPIAVVTGVTATGDPAGLHTVEIVQNGVTDTLEVQGNQGRAVAFHARLRDAIDLLRSVGQPVGTAATKAKEAAATSTDEGARVAALEGRVKTLEGEVVKLGGKVPEPERPAAALAPVAALTVATPSPQVAGKSFRLAGTYTGVAPAGIDVQTDMGPFSQTLQPKIADGLWNVMVAVADDGPHTITVRGTGSVSPTASTGSFVVAAATAANAPATGGAFQPPSNPAAPGMHAVNPGPGGVPARTVAEAAASPPAQTFPAPPAN